MKNAIQILAIILMFSPLQAGAEEACISLEDACIAEQLLTEFENDRAHPDTDEANSYLSSAIPLIDYFGRKGDLASLNRIWEILKDKDFSQNAAYKLYGYHYIIEDFNAAEEFYKKELLSSKRKSIDRNYKQGVFCNKTVELARKIEALNTDFSKFYACKRMNVPLLSVEIQSLSDKGEILDALKLAISKQTHFLPAQLSTFDRLEVALNNNPSLKEEIEKSYQHLVEANPPERDKYLRPFLVYYLSNSSTSGPFLSAEKEFINNPRTVLFVIGLYTKSRQFSEVEKWLHKFSAIPMSHKLSDVVGQIGPYKHVENIPIRLFKILYEEIPQFNWLDFGLRNFDFNIVESIALNISLEDGPKALKDIALPSCGLFNSGLYLSNKKCILETAKEGAELLGSSGYSEQNSFYVDALFGDYDSSNSKISSLNERDSRSLQRHINNSIIVALAHNNCRTEKVGQAYTAQYFNRSIPIKVDAVSHEIEALEYFQALCVGIKGNYEEVFGKLEKEKRLIYATILSQNNIRRPFKLKPSMDIFSFISEENSELKIRLLNKISFDPETDNFGSEVEVMRLFTQVSPHFSRPHEKLALGKWVMKRVITINPEAAFNFWKDYPVLKTDLESTEILAEALAKAEETELLIDLYNDFTKHSDESHEIIKYLPPANKGGTNVSFPKPTEKRLDVYRAVLEQRHAVKFWHQKNNF